MAYVAMGLAAGIGVLLAAFDDPVVSGKLPLRRVSAVLMGAVLALTAAGVVAGFVD